MTRNEYYDKIEEATEFIWDLEDDVFDEVFNQKEGNSDFDYHHDAVALELLGEIGAYPVLAHSGNWKAYVYEFGTDDLAKSANSFDEIADTFALEAIKRDLASRWGTAVAARRREPTGTTSRSKGSKRGQRMKKV